jgi:hypothetical protein
LDSQILTGYIPIVERLPYPDIKKERIEIVFYDKKKNIYIFWNIKTKTNGVVEMGRG